MMQHETGDRSKARPDDPLLDEAAEWIGRLRAADVADADRRAFAQWLSRSPAHRAAFDVMADLWDGLGVLGSRTALDAPSERRAIAAGRGLMTAAALAAGFVLAVALFAVDLLGDEYRTERGERLEVTLEDGSRLLLNTGSRVRVRMEDDERHVELALGGELWVDVAPDASRPFVVVTDHGRARAVGTAFGVRAGEAGTEVAVTEGRVRVGSGTSPEAAAEILVSAGERSVVSKGVEALPPEPLDAGRLAWRDGRLVYDDVALGDLVADMNRYLPRRMTVADPELARMRVSGVFRITDQDTMLEALSRALPLRWVELSERLVLLHPA